ncbi:hypothetical protein Slin14017_G121700 [Septoria linicola]|nr:hypothetical protein Slin14017_G121700 [Septoria linicola]
MTFSVTAFVTGIFAAILAMSPRAAPAPPPIPPAVLHYHEGPSAAVYLLWIALLITLTAFITWMLACADARAMALHLLDRILRYSSSLSAKVRTFSVKIWAVTLQYAREIGDSSAQPAFNNVVGVFRAANRTKEMRAEGGKEGCTVDKVAADGIVGKQAVALQGKTDEKDDDGGGRRLRGQRRSRPLKKQRRLDEQAPKKLKRRIATDDAFRSTNPKIFSRPRIFPPPTCPPPTHPSQTRIPWERGRGQVFPVQDDHRTPTPALLIPDYSPAASPSHESSHRRSLKTLGPIQDIITADSVHSSALRHRQTYSFSGISDLFSLSNDDESHFDYGEHGEVLTRLGYGGAIEEVSGGSTGAYITYRTKPTSQVHSASTPTSISTMAANCIAAPPDFSPQAIADIVQGRAISAAAITWLLNVLAPPGMAYR